MMKKQIQGYVAGVLTTALLVGGTAYAKSGFENIGVTYDNIKVYIDNTLATLTDSDGDEVEPFIYNGTTYLPVRGIAETMGAQVTWDGKTKSVHIWDEVIPGDASFLDICEPYNIASVEIYENGETFEMDGKSYSDGFIMGPGWYKSAALFNLDGRFNSLSFDIGHEDYLYKEKKVSFIVDGETVKTITLEPDQLAEHVTIPLDYGLQLKIVTTDGFNIGIANMTVE